MMNNKKEIQKRKKEQGFTALELLTISLVVLVVAAIFLVIAMQSKFSDKYHVFQYNAKQLVVNATGFQFQDTKEEIYLKELIDYEAISPIMNPFNSPKYCDTANSKVRFDGDEKFVTLKCGEYLIDDEPITNKEFTVYKVTEWSTKKKHDDDQKKVLYNYKKDGKDGFAEFYEENMFIYAFNTEHSTNYWSIDVIPSKYRIYTQSFYRSKTRVATIANK